MSCHLLLRLIFSKIYTMGVLSLLTNSWKKLWNRWWHIVDRAFEYLPQPVSQTTEKIFSRATADQITDGFNDIKNRFSDLFGQIKEEDTINLAEEDIPCAIITNESYNDPFTRARKVWVYELVEDYNSIEYCLYRDKKKEKFILWFRGTEFTEAKDYIADANILIWTHEFNERFQKSVLLYDEICEKYPDDIRVITWHSLGGTICYLIAQKKDPDRTVVFNAGSSVNPTFVMMMKDTQFQAPRTKRVFTYRILWDIVSTLSVIWYTRTFRKASVNPKELHAAMNFMPIKV